MNRSEFLRLSLLGAAGAFIYRPGKAFGAIDYTFRGTPAGIRPYLHAPRPDSMRVSWWTDKDAQTHVDYGLSADALGQTVAGNRTVMGANYHYHAARLTGLEPDTYYYYRVRTEAVTSAVFRFRTPKPIGTATGKYRVLVMGDNQLLNANERRFERFVERAKKKVEDLYGAEIEECVDLVIMPGDQVDVGTLEHYRHLHFAYNGWISPNVPIMTTIGNHETYSDPGLANYKTLFTYDDLDCLGVTSPDPEVYYAYQLANIAFVHMSSEHPGAAQLAWVRNLVDAAEAAPGVDWMISLCHKPYNAEQYIGDISGWLRTTAMPVLAETEKHVLNIGAHHHIYARGQTREWPIYHIISGGTAWDQFWGQSNEADYDDVQKTIANWAWQLIEFDLDARTMDVRCFAEGNVKLPAATRWSYNSRLVDRFHRKLGLAAPARPSLTNGVLGGVTLPLELVSSAYHSTAGEALNSTWFQVSAEADFSNPVIDRIRGVENLYGDTGAPLYEPVNTHAGLDVLKFMIVENGLPNGSFHARVRHRDENAAWSEWSAVLVFTVTGSELVGTPGLLMEKQVLAVDEDFSVGFSNGPGNATDWIGIYQKGQTPGPVASTDWMYVNGSRTSGATGIRNGVIPFTRSFAKGEWFAAFFASDGYTELAARVPFFVGEKPTLTVLKSAHAEGEAVNIEFSGGPAGVRDWVGIYRQGSTPAPGSPAVDWDYLNGTRNAPTAGLAAGSLVFEGLEKGYYFAEYLVNDGHFGIAGRVAFSVGERITQVEMASAVVQPGDDFTVSFSGGPGIAKDWMGLFRKGETPGPDPLTAYLYVDGRVDGSVTFEQPELPPGEYFVALFTDDSYTEVSNRFYFSVAGNEELKVEESKLDESGMMLAWLSRAGVEYEVEASEDLKTWESVGVIDGTGARVEALLPADPEAVGRRFFRVREK